MLLQQPRGYGGYHGTERGQDPDGGQEREEAPAEASPRHVKDNHMPRELRRLHQHSLSLSDSEAKSNNPRRTRASSVPDPTSAAAPARRQLATQSAVQGVKKRYVHPCILQVFSVPAIQLPLMPSAGHYWWAKLACSGQTGCREVSSCCSCLHVHACRQHVSFLIMQTCVSTAAVDQQ